LLKVGEGVGGAVAAGHFVDPSLFAAGAAVPALMAANAGRGAYLRSDFGRNQLLQNALTPPASPYLAALPAVANNPLLRLPPPSQ
jgi:aminoglycoside/choline kinase family phosphotransferase